MSRTPPSDSVWYDTAFGEDYLSLYAHRDEGEARQAIELVTNLLSLDDSVSIFDLCCGAGRHLDVFAAHGFQPVGGDRSAFLLGQARPRHRKLVRLDMRTLPFADASFDLVTNFFTAFGYFDSDRENIAVFGEVHRVLKPGGHFFFDFLNSVITIRLLGELPEEERLTTPSGETWIIQRRLSPDGRRAEKLLRKVRGGRLEREITESVRLFTPEEIGEAFEKYSFQVMARFGDYQGTAFDPLRSGRNICLCRKIPS